jgi:hypothetical protein
MVRAQGAMATSQTQTNRATDLAELVDVRVLTRVLLRFDDIAGMKAAAAAAACLRLVLCQQGWLLLHAAEMAKEGRMGCVRWPEDMPA